MKMRNVYYTLVHIAYDLFLKLNPRKLGAHAVIADQQGRVLVVRSRFADAWQLPGGGLNAREHVDEGVRRECQEELGVPVEIEGFTGMYYHEPSSAYVAVFRCRLVGGPLRLSHEHVEYRWLAPGELDERIRPMAEDALRFAGTTAVRRIPAKGR
ncbi:MAG: NUDIX hydrolase [Bacillota bacterium]